MADLPTQLPSSVQLIDPQTGLPTQTLLQYLTALLRVARDHESRIDELEP
jgi:hypothetical protein